MIARIHGEGGAAAGHRRASAVPGRDPSQGTPRGRSRAFGPGSWRIALAVAAVIVATSIVVAVAGTGGAGSRATASPSTKYGGLPSWLPKPKVVVGRTVVASAARPWLAVEGDTVEVDLAAGRVRALAVGPAVTNSGQFPVPATTRCRFTVTLSRVSGSVPLRAGAFTILDEYGTVHHPRVTVASGRALPTRLAAGQGVTLTLSEVLPTGNGQLRWAPAGHLPVVSWDFDVEVD